MPVEGAGLREFERIQRAYEVGVRSLHDELADAFEPDDAGKGELDLLTSLLQAIISAYGAHAAIRSETLDASTSVMYAAAEQGPDSEGGILNVPLRSLVDYGTLTSWQARFLNGILGMKRTVIVTGPQGSGRSTLLNSMVQLISVDQRIVAIEDKDPLPALRNRSFTVHMPARAGTPGFAQSLEKALNMQPTWLLAGELGRGDGPLFLRALARGSAGLATLEAPDPELAMIDWTSTNAEAALHLRRLSPILVHLSRDAGGRPRLEHIHEVSVEESTMRPVLNEKRQS